MPTRLPRHWIAITAILLLGAGLRIYKLDTIPNGLNIDEAMRGYDAYSLALTGADSYGTFLPLFLRGYDDYVAALYSYLNVPLMLMLGLSVFSLRLTSAFIGLLTIAVTYQFARRSFDQTTALLSAFLLAISPWHILTSRVGLEWGLFALGPVLSIVLLYRGLKRPGFLIAAATVAGLSLYSYSPIKAFLPILLGGFIVFYYRELYQQKWAGLAALLVFTLLAIPVYAFSFSTKGMLRLSNVYTGSNTHFIETIPLLIRNYFSYFSPTFLFGLDLGGLPIEAPQALLRLKAVGLLYWFELPLILLGVVKIFALRQKRAWFVLYWLAVAPMGINIHSASPAPYLWLSAVTVLPVLAGSGFIWLLSLMKRSQVEQKNAYQLAVKVLIACLSLGILLHFGLMVYDLFFQFPIYGARAWLYGRGPSITAMTSLKDKFDEVDLAAEDLTSSIFLLFYTSYDPATRHTELVQQSEPVWQKIDDYNIGNVRQFMQEQGCHLILTSVADAADLKVQFPHLVNLQQFSLPDGQPVYGLYGLPVPAPDRVEYGAVLGEEILLQGIAPVSPAGNISQLRPGQAICLIAQWQALQDTSTDYTVFVHLLGPFNPATNSSLWAQHDSPPHYGEKPTSTWRAGDIIQDSHILITPDDMPPGRYELVIGMYDPITQERLPIKGSNQNEAVLMELIIPTP